MISYRKIFLLFLIPSYLALSIGFFYSYENYVQQRVDDYKKTYDLIAKSTAHQLVELDESYERLMRVALKGIETKLNGRIPSNDELRKIAQDYGVSHLFIIDRNGAFIRSTNESAQRIPNLFSFSARYKELVLGKVSYLSTPMIIPFPEKSPHKFLTIWSNQFFIEVGFKVSEIGKAMASFLEKDRNITGASFLIGYHPYKFITSRGDNFSETFSVSREEKFDNPHIVQSSRANGHSYSISLLVSSSEVSSIINDIRLNYIASFSVTLGLITLLFFLSIKILQRRVKIVTNELFKYTEEGNFKNSIEILSSSKDIKNLISAINGLLKSYREQSKQMAFQVAHDIRSPLEALKSYKKELISLPVEDRRCISMSVDRIEEIAYNLLNTYRGEPQKERSTHHVLSQLHLVIIEKRMQFRKYPLLEINLESTSDFYSLFSSFSPDGFKSVLSNLINNAAEAMDYKGIVRIICQKKGQSVFVSIANAGLIPDELRERLFEKGFTTKKNGNGLGLYGAKKAIEAVGGEIQFKFQEFTAVEILVPSVTAPKHFPINLSLANVSTIYVLDDDDSVHRLWDKKLADFTASIVHYSSVERFLEKHSALKADELLLTDYEFIGSELTGFDLLERLGIPENGILVTALSSESVIAKKISSHRFKVLPKSMIAEVPLMLSSKTFPTCILIDDDKFTHHNWKRRANELKIDLHSFYKISDFLDVCVNFDSDSVVYVDSELGDVRGEVESQHIYNRGFKKILISTGYEAEEIEKYPWISDVIGKNPELAFLHI